MNWDDLKLIDAAARMRSLSGAAKSLDISQPQLSRRLKSFEDTVGARLFDRTPTGLKPTEAGLRLIPLAAEMRLKAEAAERILPDLPETALKVVRVAVDEVRARILTDRFTDLVQMMNGVELELISSHNHVDHQSRSIELQIRSCLPETDTLIARKIGELACAVYGSKSYIEQQLFEVSEKTYSNCEWIGFAPDDLWYPTHTRWLESKVVSRPRYRTNTMTTLKNMVGSGAGLGILPVFMGDSDPELLRVGPIVPELTFDEHIIVHRDLRREPAVRLAINAIAQIYKSLAPRLTTPHAAPVQDGMIAAE